MKSGQIKISRFNEGLTVFKPDYYLNKGKKIISDLLDKGANHSNLADLSDKLYQGGIFKRVFVENENKAHQYITASDMVKTQPLDTAKNISLKYTPWVDEMTLRNKQILVSCAGTVGNVSLVNESFSGCIGSQEIIRIETEQVPYGFLYAYLSTPLVNDYIQSMIYGAVVPRISPGELGNLPVLLPTEVKQFEIHNLMVKASELREEAYNSLKDAIEHFDDLKIDYTYGNSTTSAVSINRINSNYKRFDSLYGIVSEKVEKSLRDKGLRSIDIASQASDIFIGPRSKRNYVKSGIPFLTTSAMQKANPTKADRYLNRINAKDFQVKEGWILTTRSGTLGDTSFVLPCINNYAVSEDAIRIVLKDNSEISKEYLYAFLKSKIGKSSLLSGSYGSVIQHLNERYVGDIKIPILDKSIIDLISDKIKVHLTSLNEAILKENAAVELIEKEINQWQKS